VSQLPTIQSGASGDPVARAQGLLRADARTEYTDATLPIDGSFGPVTQQAVEAFQKSSSLTVDGVVGPMTWQTLLGL
jgi:peptidoglycan hydrolase-like protein with peptidoglycan-binding domain